MSGEGEGGREMEVLMLEDIEKDTCRTRVEDIWFPKLFSPAEK